MTQQKDDAVSPVIAVVLMIALTGLFAIIIYGSIYGLAPTITQPSLLAIESEIHDPDGTPYIELRHKGGDTIFLNTTGAEPGKALDLFVTMNGQTIRAVPLIPMNWRPGESIFMFNTEEGPRLTKDRTVAISSGIGCAPGDRSITAVDIASQLLVYLEQISIQSILHGPVPTPAPTPTPEPMPTPTPTMEPLGTTLQVRAERANQNPIPGVQISYSGTFTGTGITPFTIESGSAFTVTLVAPTTADGRSFQRWRLDGSPMTVNQLTLVVAVESNTIRSAAAVYN